MAKFLLFLRWLFGVSFIVAGITNIPNTVAGGTLVVLAGLLMLPPTFPFFSRITGKSFSKPVKYASVILLYAAGFFLVSRSQDAQVAEKKQQEAEKEKQEQLAFEKLPAAVKDSITRERVRLENFKKVVKARQDSITKQRQVDNVAYEAQKNRKEKLEAQFSAYDGSHRGVEQYIKDHMNDPDSYEHVGTRFIDKGDYIAVMTQFRGKNAFGGKILSSAVAKVDFEGNVLSLQML
ncbi:hypothetical protein [Hymenobacter terricola]|uniref:hypothetical protein n=1 Tax=Hymenobacter terricola TaxID=2819236 RepID=UPI001B30B8B2|nr:hypothetical protein [Hymenobacter terricola]